MNRTRPLERIRYWQGQLLAASDLRAQVANDLELRRLHNRAFHHAYGISSGLAVKFEAGGVSVTCGLAYDCSGRPLVSLRNRSVPFPPTDVAQAALVAFFDPTSPDEFALGWRGRYDFEPRLGVPLAHAVVAGGAWTEDETFVRTAARAVARPRLATGQTVPGDTPWKAWDGGIEVVIDTSTAGFNFVPRYFASAVRDVPSARFADAWFQSLGDVSPKGFTLRLFLQGIERERLTILTALGFAMDSPGIQPSVPLTVSNTFVTGDPVSRLAPALRDYAVIDKLKTNTITFKTPIAGDVTQLAAAFGVRSVTVQAPAPDPASGFEVELEHPENFDMTDAIVGKIVVRTGNNPEKSKSARVADVTDDNTLVLGSTISELQNDTLAVAVDQSVFQTVVSTSPKMVITVEDPDKFKPGQLMVRMSPPIETPPAVIESVDDPKKAGDPKTITLKTPINVDLLSDGTKPHLGVPSDSESSKVKKVFPETGESEVHVDSTAVLREGDLVARDVVPPSDPVRIQRVISKKKVVVLSNPITDLAVTEHLITAIFRVRQTVSRIQALAGGQQSVTVSNAADFIQSKFVARIDENFSASIPSKIANISGQNLILSTPIADLKAGDVIAMAEFPAGVTISGFDSAAARVTMPSTEGFKTGDVVVSAARAQASTVATVEGPTSLLLADPIDALADGDSLSIIAMSRVLQVTTPPAGTQVKVADASVLRPGDLAGPLAGFVSVTQPQQVSTAAAGSIDLTAGYLDGLLTGDAVGSPSVTAGSSKLRIKDPPKLLPGDSVTLSGRDTISGKTFTVTVVLSDATPPFLSFTIPAGVAFALRPESMTASVPFAGKPDDFAASARKEGLYVEWFGCEEQSRAPFDGSRPSTEAGDCGCPRIRNS
jgi:hypothetical protein